MHASVKYLQPRHNESESRARGLLARAFDLFMCVCLVCICVCAKAHLKPRHNKSESRARGLLARAFEALAADFKSTVRFHVLAVGAQRRDEVTRCAFSRTNVSTRKEALIRRKQKKEGRKIAAFFANIMNKEIKKGKEERRKKQKER